MLPFHFLMILTLLTSTVMAASSASFLAMWVALEINTLSFMPLIKSKGAAKYFLAQSLGSAMILAGPAFNMELSVIVGALMKAGVAPFHSWLPQVMEHLTWSMCAVLMTWQKIAPLTVIASLNSSQWLVPLTLASAIMGALGAVKQTRLRSMIAFSSITHMSWILAGFLISLPLSVAYYSIYSIMSVMVALKASKINTTSTPYTDFSFMLILLSMGGLPPLVGLFPKMYILISSSFFVSLVLIISSVMMLFVYTSIFLSMVNNKNKAYVSIPVVTTMIAPGVFI